MWLQQTVLFSRCVSVGYHLLWSVGECLLRWFWAVSSLACADQYSVGDFRGIPCRYSCSLFVQISSLQYVTLQAVAILALRCPITASQIRAPVLACGVIWKPSLGHSLAKWLQMSPYFFLVSQGSRCESSNVQRLRGIVSHVFFWFYNYFRREGGYDPPTLSLSMWKSHCSFVTVGHSVVSNSSRPLGL